MELTFPTNSPRADRTVRSQSRNASISGRIIDDVGPDLDGSSVMPGVLTSILVVVSNLLNSVSRVFSDDHASPTAADYRALRTMTGNRGASTSGINSIDSDTAVQPVVGVGGGDNIRPLVTIGSASGGDDPLVNGPVGSGSSSPMAMPSVGRPDIAYNNRVSQYQTQMEPAVELCLEMKADPEGYREHTAFDVFDDIGLAIRAGTDVVTASRDLNSVEQELLDGHWVSVVQCNARKAWWRKIRVDAGTTRSEIAICLS